MNINVSTMTDDTYKRIGIFKYRKIQKIDTAADKIDMYICPSVNWETDIIYLRKISSFETVMTGTLDQIEIYIDRCLKLKAFL